MKSNFFIAVVCAALLASCAKDRPFEAGPDLKLVEASELPPPTDGVDGEGRPRILIGSFDRIAVSVFRASDFNRSIDVDGAGMIELPLIGRLPAAGKSPSVLADDIEAALRQRYLRDPQVTVQIERSTRQRVTVEGEVGKPGIYPVNGPTTLLQSVATAEGTTEFSKLTDVVIFRNVGSDRMAALYNLDLIRRGTYPDPDVYGGDVIVVGDSPARRRFKDILAGSTLLTTPIIALINTI